MVVEELPTKRTTYIRYIYLNLCTLYPVVTGSENSKERSEKEWEKCLDKIQNLDGILIDLRKYGFTFISALIGSEVFFGLALGIQNAILLTVSTLIVVIYWLDLFYRNVVSGGLLRTIFLEMFRLDGGLAYTISSMYAKTKSEYYIVVLYAGLFATAIFMAAALESVSQIDDSSKQVSNSSTQASNRLDLLSRAQIKSELLESANFIKILEDVLIKGEHPFVLAILIIGIGFIYTMYLTSRKRRRMFSRMMKVYDYCNMLAYENGGSNTVDDIQLVIMKILQEREKGRYSFSLPIGYPIKFEDQSPIKQYNTKVGNAGTLYLAERKTLGVRKKLSKKRLWRRLINDEPDHYWILISQIGILMLNTIGTLDRPQRPDVYRFAWYGNMELTLKEKLQTKNIIVEDTNMIEDIYSYYERKK